MLEQNVGDPSPSSGSKSFEAPQAVIAARPKSRLSILARKFSFRLRA
jgi:hypothetical protein